MKKLNPCLILSILFREQWVLLSSFWVLTCMWKKFSYAFLSSTSTPICTGQLKLYINFNYRKVPQICNLHCCFKHTYNLHSFLLLCILLFLTHHFTLSRMFIFNNLIFVSLKNWINWLTLSSFKLWIESVEKHRVIYLVWGQTFYCYD